METPKASFRSRARASHKTDGLVLNVPLPPLFWPNGQWLPPDRTPGPRRTDDGPARPSGSVLRAGGPAPAAADVCPCPAGVPGVHWGPCRPWTGQGVGSETAAPKMSELPKVAGQSACGAGLGTDVPVRRDSRHASMAGQSAPLRTSFQTPTAPARVAAVYT